MIPSRVPASPMPAVPPGRRGGGRAGSMAGWGGRIPPARPLFVGVAAVLLLGAVLRWPLSAKLVPMGEEQALAEAALVVHARLLDDPVPVGSTAVFLAACLDTAKGAASPTVQVACSLCPPCRPDRIEPVPGSLRKGAEVILFLAVPASGPCRIVGQWEGPGLRPFTAQAWQAIREAVRLQP